MCARLVRTPRTPSPFSEPMPPAWCPCEGSQGEELQFLRSGLSCQVPKSNPLSLLGLRGSEHRTLAGSPMTKTEGGRNGRRERFCSAGVQPRPSTHSLTASLFLRATPTLVDGSDHVHGVVFWMSFWKYEAAEESSGHYEAERQVCHWNSGVARVDVEVTSMFVDVNSRHMESTAAKCAALSSC